ncbi:hypothetical protein Bca4012_051343 [Brassica carinata]|uniref:Uncharacterized protein n=3 Tax=Brassica TaxID=3705 RepID=A0A8S9QJU1_BRACR|nr:hypothetical protein F2Q69_00023110 [Brassica cretica]KAG2282723.1 hypothetical protein Bca52824_053943 [Brassica carinata]CAF1918160.1 unnamed protein product [Brassica napus]
MALSGDSRLRITAGQTETAPVVVLGGVDACRWRQDAIAPARTSLIHGDNRSLVTRATPPVKALAPVALLTVVDGEGHCSGGDDGGCVTSSRSSTHGHMNNMGEKKRMAQKMSKRDGEEMKERMDHGMASGSTPSFLQTAHDF